MVPASHVKKGSKMTSMVEYLRIQRLSASICHTLISQSPRHARHQFESSSDDATEASDMGVAIHDLFLEGRDRLVVIDAADWRTKAAKEARDFARSQGSIPVLKDREPFITGAVKAAQAFVKSSKLAGIFDTGKPEQTILFTAEGVECKCRPDWLPEQDFIIHVKTTSGSAEPSSWIRNQLFGMGYDIAACFYELALAGRQSIFLVIEQAPPHGCSWVALAPAAWELAYGKTKQAIQTWKLCLAGGHWPCYRSDVHYAEPFAWQVKDEQQREVDRAYDGLQAERGLQV